MQNFTARVLSVVRRIPVGRVATYGDVAAAAGSPRASRAVGNIMRTCGSRDVPCHRVVAAAGRLGGYGGNLELKRALLRAEGLTVTRTAIRDFRERRWPGPKRSRAGPRPWPERARKSASLPGASRHEPRESRGRGARPERAPNSRESTGQREPRMATSKVTVHPSAAGPAAPPGRAEDMALVERCRQGDLAAFEELYRAHAGKLFSVACRMLGNPTDAEDLLQEIFLSAHRKLDGFRGESALGTWLYRLATNHCLDYLQEPGGADEPAHRCARRRAGFVSGGGARAGRADGDEDGSRARDGPAAGRLPRRVRAPRRPGARAPGSGRGARHRGRHVEIAGAQGASQASRDAVGTISVRTSR